MKFSALALVAFAAVSGSAMAAEQDLACSNADSTLGTLTYGQADALTTVDGVDTSFINGFGAALKGNDVLFVVSPAQGKKVGELLVDGTTHRVLCD